MAATTWPTCNQLKFGQHSLRLGQAVLKVCPAQAPCIS